MALRIKSRWHNDEHAKSLPEVAGALAFIAWRLATDKAINLHGEDFIYESDEQRMAVISEYLIFQVQIVDRFADALLAFEDRRTLVTALALRLASIIQDNSLELFADSQDHGQHFINQLNQRASDYAALGFDEAEGPSYPFLRHLGYEIQQQMGTRQENRWVIDQVMDKDGPEVAKQIMRSIRDLLE